LDEPTPGLDPIARKEIRDILANLRDQGKTLLISSHELLEVELISDRVGILSEGVLQMSGKLDDLLTNREVIISVLKAPPQALEKLAAAGIQAEDRVEDRVALRIPDTVSVYQALEMCRAESLALQSIAPRRETLEELFVRVIKDAQPRVPIGAAEKKGS